MELDGSDNEVEKLITANWDTETKNKAVFEIPLTPEEAKKMMEGEGLKNNPVYKRRLTDARNHYVDYEREGKVERDLRAKEGEWKY